MEPYKIETNNAIVLYLHHPTSSRMLDALGSLDAWPRTVWASHVGLVLALVDVAREWHGIRAGGLRELVGYWLVRKCTPAANSAWNDYWFARWRLTQNTELAGAALAEIHRRAWHLDHQADPKWLNVQNSARSLLRTKCAEEPEFRAALSSELSGNSCGCWPSLPGL